MNKEQLAAKLNGREYGSEITKQEEVEAWKDGLVAIFGYSDDNVELRGAITDEIGSYNGITLRIHSQGVLPDHSDCDCEFCGYNKQAKQCATVTALWDKEPGYSWTYKTDLPHATFEIVEGAEKHGYCRGIVLSVADLPKLQ